MNWRLLDDALLAEISRRAKVPVSDAVALDEKIDPWLHRLTRPLWGTGADGASAIVPVNIFDADEECALRGEPGVSTPSSTPAGLTVFAELSHASSRERM